MIKFYDPWVENPHDNIIIVTFLLIASYPPLPIPCLVMGTHANFSGLSPQTKPAKISGTPAIKATPSGGSHR
jgi:hypothetical protein